MAPDTQDLQAILRRMEKLESQNRGLKHTALAVMVLLASTLMAGFTIQRPAKPAAVPETLAAQRFVLKNMRGEMRAELALDMDEPRMTLYDANGKERASLCVVVHMPHLILRDANEKERVSLFDRGDSPTLILRDASQNPRAMLSVGINQAWLSLLSSEGKAGAEMSVTPGGPSLQLSDAPGFKAVIGTVDLQTTRTGEAHRTSAASVALFEKDGQVIWRAP